MTAIWLAKKRPHPLTRRFHEKRATSAEKFLPRKLITELYGRKPYTPNRTVGHFCETELRLWDNLPLLVLHVQSPDDFVSAVDDDGESDHAAKIHILQSVDHLAGAVLHQQSVDDNQC